jgi:alpha-2-macroglobulin
MLARFLTHAVRTQKAALTKCHASCLPGVVSLLGISGLRDVSWLAACFLLWQGGLAGNAFAAEADTQARVTFAPQGEVKAVRQVSARFSLPMVAFGDPRLPAPFDIQCYAKGQGHWLDDRQWAYDFEADLPAGLQCRFSLKKGLQSVAGTPIPSQSFSFSTGGPAIVTSLPEEGIEYIDESQVFLLGLDAPVTEDSVKQHAACSIQGVGELFPLKLITGQAREQILREQKDRASQLFSVLFKNAQQGVLSVKDRRLQQANIVVAQCSRPLPAGSEVSLHWDAGITSVSGVVANKPQVLRFKVRDAFKVNASCTRTNAKAGCIPVLPIQVQFNAPVSRRLAEAIRLKLPDGSTQKPVIADYAQGETLESVQFKGPFTANSRVTLQLPDDFKDDAGRVPVNARAFPLAMTMDVDPPLIKFPAKFGILERYAQPALPVTVRNVEVTLRGTRIAPGTNTEQSGRVGRLQPEDDAELAAWYFKVTQHPYGSGESGTFLKAHDRYPREGEIPLLIGNQGVASTEIRLPRRQGQKTFEVLGIPLQKPGFYVVEFASDRLGAALHGEQKPYYVSSSALVTNLAVHYKKGHESSLVWVTRLDNAKPVSGAEVRVSTCDGVLLWQGKTDRQGRANIAQALEDNYRKSCYGHLVTARKDDDLSFMFSQWDDGLSPWQFNLGGGETAGPVLAHTVFDRPLFRAGETVSMKHFVRMHTGKGLRLPQRLPDEITLTHQGSGETETRAVRWANAAGTSSWAIPKEAKLGTYVVTMNVDGMEVTTGHFRVEQYRVPLMHASLKPPAAPVVNQRQLQVDVQLNYLAGGPAAGLPVKFRSRLEPYTMQFAQYEAFRFGGERPQEGLHAIQPFSYDPEEGWSDGQSSDQGSADSDKRYPPRTQAVTLDGSGGARVTFDRLPGVRTAHALQVEMEYADPNGQILTAATQALLLPSAVNLGIKMDSYFATQQSLAFKVLALDSTGKPLVRQTVAVEAYQRHTYAYRKRLLGGFYAYEQTAEVKHVGAVCDGQTDGQGLLSCKGAAPPSGELILVATTKDSKKLPAIASQEVYVADEDGWYSAGASDRIDILADKREYAPGETAQFEVRMPFREATALVTVEREGVLASFVSKISMKSPVVKVPIAAEYGPNAYVSVMVVRGRVNPQAPGRFAWLKRMVYQVGQFFGLVDHLPVEVDTRPTALVDLSKPAFKLGMTQIKVGWQGYALKVKVEPERTVYRVREQAKVKLTVTDPAGKPLSNAEVALAAVDEGLLQLVKPDSWQLLEAMMQRRPIEVYTSTAQSQVIGKRHFGKKAVAPGGGGGQGANARELFDTLLLWKPVIKLDKHGQASVSIPLNDALTSFRIAAIAHAGASRFGSGSALIRTTQDLMLFSGLPPFVREGDQLQAMVTVRNASQQPLTTQVTATPLGVEGAPKPQRVKLAAGQAATLAFAVRVPYNLTGLDWQIDAAVVEESSAQPQNRLQIKDRLKVHQQVGAAYPVRVYQQTIKQLQAGQPWQMTVQAPAQAVPGRGGIDVRLNRSLVGSLSSVREWMQRYPYICLEQRASVAVTLEDQARWNSVMLSLGQHLDSDGLARYFPMDWLQGDDSLTSYLLQIADAAGYDIPETARERMLKGLEDFVAGRIHRYGSIQTADVVLRKLAAIDALARYDHARPEMLDALEIRPELWPTSGVIDWLSILKRMPALPEAEQKHAQAMQVLQSRWMVSGTQFTFSTEKQDDLWWLMVSPDVNAARALDLLAADPQLPAEDGGRLARGLLSRQQAGHWRTTLANAWGVLALRHFQKAHEQAAVTGQVELSLAGQSQHLPWSRAAIAKPAKAITGATQPAPWAEAGGLLMQYAWPQAAAPLQIQQQGEGKPWAFVTAKAALPLQAPLFTGYRLQREVKPVSQKTAGRWQRGDVYRVRLTVDAQADMTWVVINDPVPSGATILGSGLGGDSQQLTQNEQRLGWQRPAYEERALDGFRAYYAYVPKGKFTVEYTVRLNQPGQFSLPGSRVEAMYAPEVFAELPVPAMQVQ